MEANVHCSMPYFPNHHYGSTWAHNLWDASIWQDRQPDNAQVLQVTGPDEMTQVLSLVEAVRNTAMMRGCQLHRVKMMCSRQNGCLDSNAIFSTKQKSCTEHSAADARREPYVYSVRINATLKIVFVL